MLLPTSRRTSIYLAIIVLGFAIIRCRIALSLGQYGLKSDMNFREARATLGGYDSGTYLQGALALADGSFRNEKNNLLWVNWPPGMYILEAAGVKIFGFSGSAFLFMSAISCSIMAIITYLVAEIIRKVKTNRQFLLYLLFIYFLLSSVTQGWILDQGIMYAENPHILFASLAIFVAGGKFLSDKKYINSIIVGTCLGLAAYFRAVGFATIELILILTLICLIWLTIMKIRKQALVKIKMLFSQLGIITITAYATLTPWIIFRNSWLKAPLQWITGANDMWTQPWKTDAQLIASGMGIVKGIDNWACHLDTIRCEYLFQHDDNSINYLRECILVIIHNLSSFIWMRISAMWQSWSLNGRWLFEPLNHYPTSQAPAEGMVYLALFILALFTIYKVWKPASVLALVELASIAGSTLPLILIHLESRYFLPCKVLSVIILIVNVRILFPESKET